MVPNVLKLMHSTILFNYDFFLIGGEISITSDMQMTPTLWQKAKNQRAF